MSEQRLACNRYRFTPTANNRLRVDLLIDELLGLTKELTREDGD